MRFDFPGSAAVRLDVQPVKVLSFEQGRVEVLTVGDCTIARGRFAPGCHWSRPEVAGHPRLGSGPGGQIGVVVSGRARVRLPDGGGAIIDLLPGDFFRITPGSDAWVVGYRPLEILYLGGIDGLVKEVRRSAAQLANA